MADRLHGKVKCTRRDVNIVATFVMRYHVVYSESRGRDTYATDSNSHTKIPEKHNEYVPQNYLIKAKNGAKTQATEKSGLNNLSKF